MSTFEFNPSDRLRQQVKLDHLPADYSKRIETCESIIAVHELRRKVANDATKWGYFRLGFDAGCIAVGSFFFFETHRLANEDMSFVRTVTTNLRIRRACTPIPFFSALLVAGGVLCIPSDYVGLSAAREQFHLENLAITGLANNMAELLEEAMQSKA